MSIYFPFTLSRTALSSKNISTVMLSVKRLVEDWLLDIAKVYELKQQKVKVKGDAGNQCM